MVCARGSFTTEDGQRREGWFFFARDDQLVGGGEAEAKRAVTIAIAVATCVEPHEPLFAAL